MLQQLADKRQQVSQLFETDDDLKRMVVRHQKNNRGFISLFNEGYSHYISGNWFEASAIFFKIKSTFFSASFKDKATLNLLSYMDQSKFIAPKDWQGCRVLTEK